MINENEISNAQSWELEITCKNRKYLDAVVLAILKYGMLNFEVKAVEVHGDKDGVFEGRYLVLIWCCWFHNLSSLCEDLKKIEEELN